MKGYVCVYLLCLVFLFLKKFLSFIFFWFQCFSLNFFKKVIAFDDFVQACKQLINKNPEKVRFVRLLNVFNNSF